jgi:uncharacterized membrane protein
MSGIQQLEPLPKLKVKRTRIDWVIEFTSFVFMIILIALPLVYSKQLPDKIPTHFNISGVPDGFGSKFSLWLLPLMGFVMYIGFTILESFPNIYNYPVKITAENMMQQYQIATRLMRILKTVILMIFSYLTYKTIDTALGKTIGLGKAFLPVSLLLTFGVIVFFLANMYNSRYKTDRF